MILSVGSLLFALIICKCTLRTCRRFFALIDCKADLHFTRFSLRILFANTEPVSVFRLSSYLRAMYANDSCTTDGFRYFISVGSGYACLLFFYSFIFLTFHSVLFVLFCPVPFLYCDHNSYIYINCDCMHGLTGIVIQEDNMQNDILM